MGVKEVHRQIWIEYMHRIFPQKSFKELDREYDRCMNIIKNVGIISLGLTIGYFAAKRK